jgi:L-fucose mutarotase
MLIGLHELLTPDLLHALAAMGHGDTIALVDANYPASRGRRVIPLTGAPVAKALEAVLSLLPLDSAVPDPAFIMDAPGGHESVLADINAVLRAHGAKAAKRLEHDAFMEVANAAYAIVLTGERRFYGNVVLTKGVIPPEK